MDFFFWETCMRSWLGMLQGGLKGGWGRRVLGGCWRERGEVVWKVVMAVVVLVVVGKAEWGRRVELDG